MVIEIKKRLVFNRKTVTLNNIIHITNGYCILEIPFSNVIEWKIHFCIAKSIIIDHIHNNTTHYCIINKLERLMLNNNKNEPEVR